MRTITAANQSPDNVLRPTLSKVDQNNSSQPML